MVVALGPEPEGPLRRLRDGDDEFPVCWRLGRLLEVERWEEGRQAYGQLPDKKR